MGNPAQALLQEISFLVKGKKVVLIIAVSSQRLFPFSMTFWAMHSCQEPDDRYSRASEVMSTSYCDNETHQGDGCHEKGKSLEEGGICLLTQSISMMSA